MLAGGFVGNFAADILAGGTYSLALVLSLCNTTEIVIGWKTFCLVAYRRPNGCKDLSDPRTLLIFFATCGGIAPALAATLAGPIFSQNTGSSASATGIAWYLSDAVGMLTIAPLILSFRFSTVSRWGRPAHFVESVGTIGAAVAAATFAFVYDGYALVFLIIPIVLLPAFRVGFTGAALTCCLLSLIAVVMTWHGHGPFAAYLGLTQVEHMRLLQSYILTIVLISLPVAAGISARRRAETALVRNREDLIRTIDSMPAMIASWDSSLHNRFCNRAYVEWFGMSPEKVMKGMHIRDVIGPKLFDLNRPHMEAALRGEMQTFEREIVNPAGLRRVSQAHYIPDIRNGKTEGFYVLVFDISRLKQTEAALQIAKGRAEGANRAKTSFLSMMSHELRTPLNAILGFTEMVTTGLAGPINEKQSEYLSNVKNSATHLLNLVSDLLEISMIESGKLTIASEVIAVEPLIKSAIAGLEVLARKTGIGLAEKIAAVPAVRADSTRLRQALINLGTNAIKYNRQGGHVEFSAERIGDVRIRITVSDSGRGIAAERQSELFKEFSRLGAESGTIEGVGIGLALTKRLIEAMHGSIGFSSVEGKGSQFWIELPVAPEKQ